MTIEMYFFYGFIAAACVLGVVAIVCAFMGGDAILISIIAGGLGVFCAFMPLVIKASIADAAAWSTYAEKQHCVAVGTMSGDVFNTVGIGSNGQLVVGVGTTSSKTAYRCDDGLTHWR